MKYCTLVFSTEDGSLVAELRMYKVLENRLDDYQEMYIERAFIIHTFLERLTTWHFLYT